MSEPVTMLSEVDRAWLGDLAIYLELASRVNPRSTHRNAIRRLLAKHDLRAAELLVAVLLSGSLSR